MRRIDTNGQLGRFCCIGRWLLRCIVALLMYSMASAADKESATTIPASYLEREGHCIEGHRHEHWSCFARLMQEVPKDAPWRTRFEYLGRGLWRADVAEAGVDGIATPKEPPGLPPARGLDRLYECQDEGWPTTQVPATRAQCFDRELPAALNEAPRVSPELRHSLDGLRKQYAELDASDLRLDELFHPANKPVVVFGMTLGKPFKVPECALDAIGRLGRTPCWWRPKLSLMGRQVLLNANTMPTWVKPSDQDSTPTGAAAAIDVEVIDGNLEAVYIPTMGLRFQDLVIATLNEKFGTPKSPETVIKQNAFGAKFQAATIDWEISGVKIIFDGGDLDKGMILLSTAKSQYLQKAAARLKQNF